jgi:hypothetical protein
MILSKGETFHLNLFILTMKYYTELSKEFLIGSDLCSLIVIAIKDKLKLFVNEL